MCRSYTKTTYRCQRDGNLRCAGRDLDGREVRSTESFVIQCNRHRRHRRRHSKEKCPDKTYDRETQIKLAYDCPYHEARRIRGWEQKAEQHWNQFLLQILGKHVRHEFRRELDDLLKELSDSSSKRCFAALTEAHRLNNNPRLYEDLDERVDDTILRYIRSTKSHIDQQLKNGRATNLRVYEEGYKFRGYMGYVGYNQQLVRLGVWDTKR